MHASLPRLIVGSLLLGSILFLTASVRAASTASVTATVTVQNISVTVSDGTVTYGTMGVSTSGDTTASGLNDSQTATNNGNVTENVNIKGQNSANWTLGAAAGVDTYAQKFCTTNCDSSPTWTALTTSYQTLASSIATSGTSVFDLQITTPTSSTNFTQQSVDVTVQAVAS